METLTTEALNEIKKGAKFNGKLYKADKKGRYMTAYINGVKYNIYYQDVDQFLKEATETGNKEESKGETYGTGCITTAYKAHKYGFDAIEN